MKNESLRFVIFFLVLGLTLHQNQLLGQTTKPTQHVSFNEDIRPILAMKCLKCHGSIRAQGGLKLNSFESAISKLESDNRAIVPGKSHLSELIKRIESQDDTEIMPPEGDPLTKQEIAKFKTWTDQGAKWELHWSYNQIQQPQVPTNKNTKWSSNEIDRFILRQLEAEGIQPNRPASRYRLIRRVSLDLTGLPPTMAEIDAFVNDNRPDAYEKLVDRLLAKPAYGERWAQMWLDLARYADTQGYEKDRSRTIWRYRDWTIAAFNRNLPFDQFTIEQIAGDLLPNPTTEQLVATAFHRNTMTNTEGGTSDEEFHSLSVMDRVNTTMQVWMGTTIGCVQCHSHPYDPIQNKEYYNLYSYFNNTEDFDRGNEAPFIPTPSPDQAIQKELLTKQKNDLLKEFNKNSPELAAAQQKWETSLKSAGKWSDIEDAKITAKNGTTFKQLEDGSFLATGETHANEIYFLTFKTSLPAITGFKLDVIPDPSLPNKGSGRAKDGNFVLSKISLSDITEEVLDGKIVELPIESASADFSQRNYSVESSLTDKKLTETGWALSPNQTKPHSAFYTLAKTNGDATTKTFKLTLQQAFKEPNFNIGRFKITLTSDPKAKIRSKIPLNILTIIEIESGKRNPQQNELLSKHFRNLAPQLAGLKKQIAEIDGKLGKIKIPTTPIMRELAKDKSRKTHMFIRGAFLNKGEQVTSKIPKIFHPVDTNLNADRLQLAKWLVAKENPLTPRVIVNRFWERVFGIGIVETAEDFGSQGTKPTHPDLLDWLAYEFSHDLKWDVKALLKLMVMSETYKQSSAASKELLERDLFNSLYARGPRFRLTAEMVRDQALAVSGLLSSKMNGPSVMPKQPEGIWQIVYSGEAWRTSTGEDQHRRGLYTFWRRTSPYPSMMAFDAPSREVCTVRRLRTNTPLQALVTMNDPVFVEAAQALAGDVVANGGKSLDDKIHYAFKKVLIRIPTDREIKRIKKLFETEYKHYQENVSEATQLATSEVGAAPKEANIAELAAWTVISNVLLNIDEFLMKG